MPLLQDLPDAPGFLKCNIFGQAGSGKTTTAVRIACRLHQLIGSKKPIAFFDTEGGSDYVIHLIHELSGMRPIRVKSRSFDQLVEARQECIGGAADIFLPDSLTHIWRDLLESYMKARKRQRLRIDDIGEIKRLWHERWSTPFLNCPLHMIVCGREADEWETQENEDTGKRELVSVGKKMAAEKEFGYEANLMIYMDVRRNDGNVWKPREPGQRIPELLQVALVVKDKFDIMNGLAFTMPEGPEFDPFLKRLNPSAHSQTVSSGSTVDADDFTQNRAATDRDILIERIEGELLRGMPGQTATEKKLRLDVMEACFQSRSWTEISKRCPLTNLRVGLEILERWMRAVDIQRRDGIDLAIAVDGAKKDAFTRPEAKGEEGAFEPPEKPAQDGEEFLKSLEQPAAPAAAVTPAPAPAPKPPAANRKAKGSAHAAAAKPPRVRRSMAELDKLHEDAERAKREEAEAVQAPAPEEAPAKPRVRRSTAEIQDAARRALGANS